MNAIVILLIYRSNIYFSTTIYAMHNNIKKKKKNFVDFNVISFFSSLSFSLFIGLEWYASVQ